MCMYNTCLCVVLDVYCFQSLLWLSAVFTAQGMMHQEQNTVCVMCTVQAVWWESKSDKCRDPLATFLLSDSDAYGIKILLLAAP